MSVDVLKEKSVTLDKYNYPIKKVSPIQTVMDAYNSLALTSEEPKVIFSGREYSTSIHRVKLLKAITIASVNKNQEYCDTLTDAVVSLLPQILSNKEDLIIPMDINANKFVTKIIKELNIFISEQVH